jgi:hypothetical protein
MLFNHRQHMKMADLLNKKAEKPVEPRIQKKRAAMAKVFQTLAQRAAAKTGVQ